LPIRFRLAPADLDRVAFAYSPLLEAVLSLHVLVEPKHHPLQHPWVRAMRRLSPTLKREIEAFAFLYRGVLPDCFLPGPDERYLDFHEELEELARLDARTIAYEFTRPVCDHGGQEPREARLDDPAQREAILAAALPVNPSSVPVLELLFDDPPAVAGRLAKMLGAYWREAFAEEWRRVEPQLAETVSAAGRDLADRGLYPFLLGLSPYIRVDAEAHEFGKDVPHDHTVEVTEERRLVLVPSVYVWPHARINCDDPWPLALVYPAPPIARAARRELPPPELLRALRALGEATRLRALQLIAERPRSTQELAPLIGISEAGLSKHLRLLAEAGLLETRREGYYVLYSLVGERLAAISDALPAFLAPRL